MGGYWVQLGGYWADTGTTGRILGRYWADTGGYQGIFNWKHTKKAKTVAINNMCKHQIITYYGVGWADTGHWADTGQILGGYEGIFNWKHTKRQKQSQSITCVHNI